MVAVMVIVLIICLGLIGAYSSMQKGQRLNNSTEKLLSTLHLARSLAISNNAIYHVRIDNWAPNDGLIPTTDASLPGAFPELWFAGQWIKVYSFPSSHDALTVATEDDVTEWNSFKDWNAETLANASGGNPPNVNVASVRMESGTYLGIQNPSGAGVPSKTVLSFYPDGTAHTPDGNAVYFYVTDVTFIPDTASGGNNLPRTPYNDFRDPKPPVLSNLAANYYLQLNSNRHDLFNHAYDHQLATGSNGDVDMNSGSASGLRMIRVLPGGSIRLLDPTVPTERLP